MDTATFAPEDTKPADRHAEAGLTLDSPQPRALGFWDQSALWANLGISLIGFTGAIYVLAPGMSLGAALTAVVVGTLIGTLPVALAALAGARTGRPAMVMLRGLFGARLSYVPTMLNLLQLLGWATFELVIIGGAAKQLTGATVTWPFVLAAGALTIVMAIWPLGSVRLLRRVVLVVVLVAMAYFAVELLRQPLPSLTRGSWDNFWVGADTVIAVAVSWVPLAADYTRHSRSERAAFGGAMGGYSVTQIACYALGVLAFSTVVSPDGGPDVQQHNLFAAFIAISGLGFTALVARELDESFANVYSTAVSFQNLLPKVDRRLLATAIGIIVTLLAMVLDIGAYQDFLYLIGSVFVPMFAVFVVRYFVKRGYRTWDTSERAPSRWILLVPWALGFATYQLINPGGIAGWRTAWGDLAGWLHFTPQAWMSASVFSFVVAGVVALLIPARRPAVPADSTETGPAGTEPAAVEVAQ
jgi:nucleobase:cation symporter-1, NCS1 family